MIPRDRTLMMVAGGSLAAFVVALAIGYGLPILSIKPPDVEASRGRAIYQSEGCWYCHTQSVRPVANDVGLGLVTTADTANDPDGLTRIGPDLACLGDRLTDPAVVTARLTDPRSTVSSSVMPGYSHLSDAQLSALAEYLISLKCETA